MARDTLARLARLRAIGRRSATLDLAARLARQAEAERQMQESRAAIQAEARRAEPQQFALWLRLALPERERARIRVTAAAEATGAAREALAQALREQSVVDEALAARRDQAAREDARKEQNAIDDLVQRPRGGR